MQLKPSSQFRSNQLKETNLLFIDYNFKTGTKKVEGAKDMEVRNSTAELQLDLASSKFDDVIVI